MENSELIIINNEKIFKENNNFYCSNLDLKILTEGLNKYFNVKYIARHSHKREKQKIFLEDVKESSNLFTFIKNIIKTFKLPETRYLIISITPYTFLSFLILFLFRKKIFVYLFSNGHEEYKHILGSWSVWIYNIMYLIVTKKSTVIVNHKRLSNKKNSHLINSSRLDKEWFEEYKQIDTEKAKILYVGRINPEKGILDLMKILNEIKLDFSFSIAGNSVNDNIFSKNTKALGYISDSKKLIDTYDIHNIVILPSYTEASPYVVDEALSRKRPVIIFEEINYIVRGKRGIFVSKRTADSLSKTIKYIINNYFEIQKNIEKNVLPTKDNMIKEISDIINLKKLK
jgi:glycosyltransferase involved in cell wall biosynthesis